MNNILLIGGYGAVGEGIRPFFNEHGYNVSLTSHNSFTGLKTDFDVVINLAATTVDCELHKPNKYHQEVITGNCLLPVEILAEFLPKMRLRGYGRIIMMSSVFSDINIIGQGVYSASKAFVDKLVKITALENAQYGITVNSIQLGYMGIGMGRMDNESGHKAMSKIAMKRYCSMEELYRTILYIIDTEYLTGQNIRLDGGIR